MAPMVRFRKVGAILYHTLILALLCFSFLSCNERWRFGKGREYEILKTMVERVSLELSRMGFQIDTDEIFIEVQDPEHMASIYNQINDKSRPEMEDFLKTPEKKSHGQKSHYRDGATARLAFYDPNSQTIIFQDGAASLISMADLAHELTHAFQDQVWSFDTLWHDYQEKPSRELYNIINFLVEGYAELVRETYEQSHSINKRKESELAWELSKLYDKECVMCGSVDKTAQMPYLAGTRFLLHQYKQGGWEKVDKNLTALPASTEQLLHPLKFGKDEPIEVDLPLWEPKEKEFKRVANGCMGEAFLLGKLLSISMLEEQAFFAATGWDGDVAHVYRSPADEEVLLWRIVFDSVEDAMQLERGVSKLGMGKNVMRMGRAVDWIITDDDELLKTSRIFMSKNPMTLEKPNEEDKASTLEEEKQFRVGKGMENLYPSAKIHLKGRT